MTKQLQEEQPERPQEPCAPLPTAIKGRDDGWKVVAAPPIAEAASVDVAGRMLRVPTGDSVMEQAIRAHEMGHIKWSPSAELAAKDRALYGIAVTDGAVAAAEEFRINELLAREGFSMDALHHPAVSLGDAVRMVLRRDWAEFVFSIARWHGTAAQDFLAAALTEYGNLSQDSMQYVSNMYTQIENYADYTPTFLDLTLPLAQLLDNWASDNYNQWPQPGDDEEEEGGESDEGDDRITEGQKYSLDALTKTERFQPRIATGAGSKVKWGIMQFSAVPLDRSLAGRWARKRIAEEEGAIPRAMYRLTTDGRVFDRRVRKLGGTVLIDTSGSMHLSAGQVLSLVEAAPGCTIAIYCGEGSKGYLRIIARNGRIADQEDMDIAAGGNIVDGPALEWLIGEEAPHIWVCDGGVTGRGDAPCATLTAEAYRLAKMGEVTRLPNVGSALEYMRKRRVTVKK